MQGVAVWYTVQRSYSSGYLLNTHTEFWLLGTYINVLYDIALRNAL
jgi:hypothetical protein